MDVIVKALRNKYRFPSNKGQLTIEQLFDLPLQAKNGFDLDSVAKEISRELREQAEESFVDRGSNPRKVVLEESLSIVVFVIETKQAENALARDRAARAAEKQTLLDALHNARARELMNLSPEELQQRIAALGE